MLKVMTILSMMAILVLGSTANAAVFTSQTNGSWHEGNTWDQGDVPGAGDDVIITKDIRAYGTLEVNNLTVQAEGYLHNSDSHTNLTIHGDLNNSGSIHGVGWNLGLFLEGDLVNNGSITNYSLSFSGVGAEHHLAMAGNATLAPVVFELAADTGKLFIDSDISISSTIDLNYNTVELVGESSFNLLSGYINFGTIEANGNPLNFAEGTYLYYVTIDEPVIEGVARVGSSCVFNGTTIVDGLMRNTDSHVILAINGDIINNGTISGRGWDFSLHVSGDATNNGVWDNYGLIFVGAGSTHTIAHASGKVIGTQILELEAGTGALTAGSHLSISSVVDLNEGLFVLPVGRNLEFSGSSFSFGQVTANGNSLTFINGAYIYYLEISNPVLMGTCLASGGCLMTGEVVVEGTLGNTNDHITLPIEGNITNNGNVVGKGWNFTVAVTGNVINNSVWDNHMLHFTGAGLSHEISQASSTHFTPNFLELEAGTGSLTAISSISCGAVVDLNEGMLVLSEGEIFSLESDYLMAGSVVGNGSEIMSADGTYFYYLDVSDVTLSGSNRIHSNVEFSGTLTNSGTLRNVDSHISMNVNGDLINHGEIYGRGWNFDIHVTGNLENHNIWDNHRTYVQGSADQEIQANDVNLLSSEAVFVANIGGGDYQWFKNGNLVEGQTNPEYYIGALGTTEQGSYYCTSSEGTSRTITIAEPGNLSAAEALPAQFAMEQNFPNPFNPSTTISFSVPKDSHVDLKIYNVRGEVVEVLKSGEMQAGTHSLVWQGQGKASGVYLYRIEAGDFVQTRRMTLVK